MTAERVLFLSGLQVYPTISGGTLRSFALAGALRRHGFEVRVHSLTGRRVDYAAGRPSGLQAWPDGTEEHVDRGLSSLFAWLSGYLLRLPPVWVSARLVTRNRQYKVDELSAAYVAFVLDGIRVTGAASRRRTPRPSG